MIKKILFLSFILLAGCSSPNPPSNTAKPKAPAKHKPASPKSLPGSWNIMTYPGAQGNQNAKKYVKSEADGSFSNSNVPKDYLNAVIIVDKNTAGILLHLSKKSNPIEKYSGPAHIRMKNSAGNEIELTSSRGWNKTGGLLIEKNNNDYSQFRIFMLQSEGVINVEIRDESASVYNFDINTSGFSDSFNQI